MKDAVLITCPECKRSFYTRDPRKRYCNSKCRFSFWSRTHPRVSTNNPDPAPIGTDDMVPNPDEVKS